MRQLSRLQFTLLAILACLLWSTAFVAIKIGMQFNTTPINFAGQRFILAGFMILPFTGNINTYLRIVDKHLLVILKVAFLQTFMLYLFFYLGLVRIPGALGAVIVGASPLASSIWAHFLMENDRLNRKKLLAFVVGIVGVTTIAFSKSHGSKDYSETILIGTVCMLLSVLSSSFAGVYIAKEKKGIPPLVLSSAQLIFGGVMLSIMGFLIEGYPVIGDVGSYSTVLFYLSFVSASAFSIWFKLLKQPNVMISYLNLWKFIMPVFGAIFSWTLLKEESPSAMGVIGVALVGMAIMIFNVGFRKNSAGDE